VTDRNAWIHTAQTEARPCPACGRVCDAATGVSLDDPRPTLQIGDLSVCAYCRAVLVVTTIGWRLATQTEFDRLDPALRQLIQAFNP
jgi:hypothetical protein